MNKTWKKLKIFRNSQGSLRGVLIFSRSIKWNQRSIFLKRKEIKCWEWQYKIKNKNWSRKDAKISFFRTPRRRKKKRNPKSRDGKKRIRKHFLIESRKNICKSRKLGWICLKLIQWLLREKGITKSWKECRNSIRKRKSWNLKWRKDNSSKSFKWIEKWKVKREASEIGSSRMVNVRMIKELTKISKTGNLTWSKMAFLKLKRMLFYSQSITKVMNKHKYRWLSQQKLKKKMRIWKI